jgi:hypothetical protein
VGYPKKIFDPKQNNNNKKRVGYPEIVIHFPKEMNSHNKSMFTYNMPKAVITNLNYLYTSVSMEKFTQEFPLGLLWTHFFIKRGVRTLCKKQKYH